MKQALPATARARWARLLSIRQPVWLLPLVLLAGLAALPAAAQAPPWQQLVTPSTVPPRGSGSVWLQDAAADAAGNLVVAGYFTGQVALGSTLLTSAGGTDVVLASWNPGTGLWNWAVAAGGTANDRAQRLALRGNAVYLAGSYQNTPTDANAVRLAGQVAPGYAADGLTDMFVAKYTLTATGASGTWLRTGGGPGSDVATHLAVSGTSVYVAGVFGGSAAAPGPATIAGTTLTPQGSTGRADSFVAHYLDQGATALGTTARAEGSPTDDFVGGLAVGPAGVYLLGYYVDPATTVGGVPLPATNSTQLYVARYAPATLAPAWVSLGGTATSAGYDLAVSGNRLYVAGSFTGSGQLAGTAVSAGGTNAADAFVACYTDTGTGLAGNWAETGGGAAIDNGRRVHVSGSSVYLTGSFTNDAVNAQNVYVAGQALVGLSTTADNEDMFVAKYTDNGATATRRWAQAAGGHGANQGLAVVVQERRVYTLSSTGTGGFTVPSPPGLLAPPSTTAIGEQSDGTGAWLRLAYPLPASMGSSSIVATATDAAGNVFVAGNFTGAVGFGGTVLASAGGGSLFVAKWDVAAGAWAWAAGSGGSLTTGASAIAVAGHQVYVTGQASGQGGATLAGSPVQVGSRQNIFVAKFIDNGSSYTNGWGLVVPAGRNGTGLGVAATGSSVYVTGSFDSDTLRISGQQLPPTSAGNLFLAKFVDNGASVGNGWALTNGRPGSGPPETGYQHAAGVAVAGSRVYITGGLNGSRGTLLGGVLLPASGNQDGYLACFTDQGSTYATAWVTTLGSAGWDEGRGLAVNGANVYVTGVFDSATPTTIGGRPLAGAGGYDVFLAKYTDTGAALAPGWVEPIGGAGYEYARTVAVSGPKLYVAGTTDGAQLTTAGGTVTGTSFGSWFVARYTDLGSTSGNSWLTGGGGAGIDVAWDVVPSGNRVFVGGYATAPASFGSLALATPAEAPVALLATLADEPRPVLTALAPARGPVGSTIALSGSWLDGATSVTFSGASGPVTVGTFTVNSAGNQLTGVVVPAGAVTGPVTVTTPFGTSNGLPFTVGYPDVVISTGRNSAGVALPAGDYHNVTITATGGAQLAGGVVVHGTLLVQAGGMLTAGCAPITGPGSFVLEANTVLAVCHPEGISLSGAIGAIQVAGSRSFAADATYAFYASTTQHTGTGLPARVRNLEVTQTPQLILTAPVAVAQRVLVGQGATLALNGQALTLLSDSAGTALVWNVGSGRITGNTATVQRFLSTTNRGPGYRHYASPVSGNFIDDLRTAAFAPVLNAAYNTSATPGAVTPFPNVFGYDQARVAGPASTYAGFEKGWYSPTAVGAGPVPFEPGQGYAVHLPGTEKVDFTGTLRNGSYTVSLARNTGAAAAESGWALVGNPYPSPINWASMAEADRAGLEAAMYVFESTGPYTGAYRAYVNGLGAGSPLIGTAQGFFVRVAAGQTASMLTFRNDHRLTNYTTPAPVRRPAADPRPLLHLALSGAGLTDDLYLYAEAGATPAAEAAFDAVKLPNSHGLNLATVTAAGQALAIDGRADLGRATTIPLQVGVPAAGRYTLSAPALTNLPAGTTVYLRDALTTSRTPLTANTTYTFTTATTTAPGRFWLELAPATTLGAAPAALAAAVQLFPNPAHGAATLLLPAAASSGPARLLNSLGQLVRTLPLSGSAPTLDLHGLPAGVYTLRLTVAGQALARRLVVE